jgi:DNA-directed RNA polymerase subunit RPC12/RpoP
VVVVKIQSTTETVSSSRLGASSFRDFSPTTHLITILVLAIHYGTSTGMSFPTLLALNSRRVAHSFKCAKCGNRVSPDTNLLLLSDGSPVCAACSYNCAVCKKPISHEAIMTGDESYHAACFTCKTCGRHIGELVFAKTTQGIYCMSCHNERVARSRRHAEQRKHKQKLRDPTRDKENKLREKPSNLNLREGDVRTCLICLHYLFPGADYLLAGHHP